MQHPPSVARRHDVLAASVAGAVAVMVAVLELRGVLCEIGDMDLRWVA